MQSYSFITDFLYNLSMETLQTRRVVIYLAFAFGIAWLFGLIVYLTGGMVDSPVIVPGLNITLATVLIALGYMWSPALAHILTRVITREGWRDTLLRPNFRRGWPYWFAAWLLPAVLTLVGAAVFFLLQPQYFDPELTLLRSMLPPGLEINLWLLVAVQIVQAMLIAAVINSLFTFGEEFGWRAYLLPKLLPLGARNAVLVSGVIWGLWHAPVIAMGHNYGLEYPGFPWSGILMMCVFTTAGGALISWVTLRGGSVWPAVIAHAVLNGIAGTAVLFTQGEPNPLVGPLPVGIVGMAGFILFALWLLLRPDALEPVEPVRRAAAGEPSEVVGGPLSAN